MPPFEGFDPSSINLRQASSLYDNLLDEVSTYSSGIKEKLHISFRNAREDVVATRDIIVGKHPLYEPGTPEWDEFVLGKDVSREETELNPSRPHSRTSQTRESPVRPSEQPKRPEKGAPKGCNKPSDVLEWLEMFSGVCITPKGPRQCWTNEDFEPTEDYVPKVYRKPSVQSEEASLPKPTPTIHKNRVLYPIAKYPSRLNSPRLVEQRRRFLERQIDFKPLRMETKKPRKPKKY